MVKIYRYHSLCYTVMRITTLLIGIQACFTSILIAGTTNAQTVNLDVQQVNVKQVFANIEKQTNVTFIYNEKTIYGLSTISLKAFNKPLTEVLKSISEQVPLQFKQAGNVIGVSRDAPAKTTSREIGDISEKALREVSGTVTDTTGQPVYGAAIKLQGTSTSTVTDIQGHFILQNVPDKGTLVISYIGYKTVQISFDASAVNPLLISLHAASANLEEVAIVSTGYQSLPKERVTGSFDQINNELINRSTGTNILDRINGIASGVIFNSSSAFTFNGIFTGASTNVRETGISIRGTSTLSPITVGTDPLIVLDNFPYNGDMRNINPNDIESITILKDAAAASIWGARAGNGVIVITTKKGNKNQAAKIDFSSTLTIGNEPNVFYDRNFLDSKDYIQAETYLFNQGYFNSDLTNKTQWPVISPVVEILAAPKAGTLSAADATAQLNSLGNNDVRNDLGKYIYQKSFNQQYSLGIRGGSPQLAYSASVGYDNNSDNLVRNGEQRLTVNSQNTYTPVKNLDITAGINYSQTNVQMNNQLTNVSSGGKYALIPYAMFASPTGSPLAIPYGYRGSYADSLQRSGFQDIHYRPLTELQMANNTAQINELILKATVTYHFTNALNAQVLYQNERQTVAMTNDQAQGTYYTDNLIDKYAQYNSTTKTFTYPFPVGDILNLNNTVLDGNNLRGQINYNTTIRKSVITAIAGAEINQSVTTGFTPVYFGYNSAFGTSSSNLNYNTSYPTNPSGATTINNPTGGQSVTTYRYLSYFGNAGYTYDSKYTLTLSGRRDGANIFGVNTNDRITPLWSAGLGWNVANEKFYSFSLLPYLKLRATYGFNGNVFNGSGYTTGTYATNPTTGLLNINTLTAPNPDLQWEKVKNINLGIDFATIKNIITGTIEIYQKKGQDLIESAPLAPSTGFTSFSGNAANTKTNGVDITLNSINLNGQIRWTTTLLFSYQHNEVTKYDIKQTATSMQTLTGNPVVGYPIYSLFSYKWAGIDQTNGNPMGYLNGNVSEDYTNIINNYNPDSLKFSGSAVPTIFGSLRNNFSYHGFGLSFNIRYELGWYFRRPSINLNYQNILTTPNSDYSSAWTTTNNQTDVPSLVYPSNTNRNTFYQYSSVLIQNGGNIRLQDIRLSYDIIKKLWANMPFSSIQLYSYANNIGILWRANKYGLDPDSVPVATNNGGHSLPIPFSISFGLRATY